MDKTTLMLLLDLIILVLAYSSYRVGYYSGKRAAYIEMLEEFERIDEIFEKERAKKKGGKNGN